VKLYRIHLEHLVHETKRLQRRAAVLLRVAEHLADALSVSRACLGSSQLGVLSEDEVLPEAFAGAIEEFVAETALSERPASEAPLRSAHRLGEALDRLLASESGGERRQLGSYYTPPAVAQAVIARSLSSSPLQQLAIRNLKVCDPACGGGAFLLEAAAGLERARTTKAPGGDSRRVRSEVVRNLWGVDLSPLGVATTKVALWLFSSGEVAPESIAEHFAVGDALVGNLFAEDGVELSSLEAEALTAFDYFRAFPEIFGSSSVPSARAGFDWIVGNPPWVAFQGRATQKITAARRAFYRSGYRAFAGYPTLHGLFVERAVNLAPLGSVSLLLPSSVSDLDGYKSTRACLMDAHRPNEPLPEFGQDAFSGVVQPCFGLIASPRTCQEPEPTRAWILQERSRSGAEVMRAAPPSELTALGRGEGLPPESFREMGFQSNRIVAERLFLRGVRSEGNFSIPLLEGRNVGEFHEGPPQLFLHPDAEVLRETRCRLRSPETYESVDLVVRQTAAYTIAAPHRGEAFRNSLIAAFGTALVDKLLLLGLLNSALFRAFHVSSQRDARQATFPQVKLSHLRRLPLPPEDIDKRALVRGLATDAVERGGLTRGDRHLLDQAVFRLFGMEPTVAESIRQYLLEMAPRALLSNLSD
jgi:hypothetical protein